MIVRIWDLDRYLKEFGYDFTKECPVCGLPERKIITNSHLQYDTRLGDFAILFEGDVLEVMCYECGNVERITRDSAGSHNSPP